MARDSLCSAADSDALRKSCNTIDGTISLLASLSENNSLDGIWAIAGNLTSDDCDVVSGPGPSFAHSSISLLNSTLAAIHEDFILGSCVPVLKNASWAAGLGTAGATAAGCQ